MDLFIYGRYAKVDLDKAQMLRNLRQGKLYQFIFMGTVQRLANIYGQLALIAFKVLDLPQLLLR